MTQDSQLDLNLPTPQGVDSVEDYTFEPIKGYPMLNWQGKRPFTNTRYYPAQLKERHGEDVNGWLNKIFWGDNLQVMSHLLKEFRGKVNLVYIDPPFDSKADYKKDIKLRNQRISSDQTVFEDKQYTDIWMNDEYLQFAYERLIIIRELINEKGCIWFHCDPVKGHYIKILLDEIFGSENFINEISWKRSGTKGLTSNQFPDSHDLIFYYAKKKSVHEWIPVYGEYTEDYIAKFRYLEENTNRKYMMDNLQNPNPDRPNLTYEWNGHTRCWRWTRERMQEAENQNKIAYAQNGMAYQKRYLDEIKGQILTDSWIDISPINSQAKERVGYPTQKPEKLLSRIVNSSSKPGDIIFDCFMGSGTTQAVAMKLGRRFIGADINLGAVQTTTKRLLGIAESFNSQQIELDVSEEEPTTYYTGFEVYNVNHYDIFRNPIQAKELLIEALEIHPLDKSNLFDGEKDGRMYKIMPVNRIATRTDLNELIAGFDYKAFEKRRLENPNKPVEHITLVCMGHESDLADQLKKEVLPNTLDVEVVDILKDRQDLQFKRDSEAKIVIQGNYLVIEKLDLLHKYYML
jgi:site-specific DNA-methyltransferase (adenine-specific)/adenine-specific DNA-methyltransferase